MSSSLSWWSCLALLCLRKVHTSHVSQEFDREGLDPAQRDRARELITDGQIAVHDEDDPAVISARIPAQPRAGAAGEFAARALGRLADAGIGVSDFALGQPSLDEVFLALTGSPSAPGQPEQGPAAGTPVVPSAPGAFPGDAR